MADIIKLDMTDIWASGGDKVAPTPTKIAQGWLVEVVPRQTWNWFENRQDQNIAYLLQKGFPEWDESTQYIASKSWVNRSGTIYRALLTGINKDPASEPTYWVKAFPESSAALEALRVLTPAANQLPYYTGTNSAAVTTLSAFGRTLIDDVDAATARATLAAQLAHSNLTALSGVTAAINVLPYFDGSTTMAGTALTAFGRSLLDDIDAPTARSTLGVYSTTETDSNVASGLATKQPLATNLTNLAALSITPNTIPYYNGSSLLGLTAVTTFGRGFLNLADAAASRTYIGADDAANLTTGTLALARLPANLTGKNASTATALETSRTIQGVPFNGTANITLSVVDKDSGVGSAILPAGTTAQRTASPVNGQIRYNSDNNEFEGYINGAWGGIGGGTPLFTVLWWPSRAAIPTGYIAADGQTLTRTTYSAAWARINAGDVPLTSDATWLATSTSRGMYSSGDGSTTFRAPDLNGKQSGTFAAPFLRGDGTNSTGVAGQFQSDALQSHTHTTNISATSGSGSGLLTSAGGSGTTNLYLANGPLQAGREATETRPTNVTGVYIIKLIGGASDLTQEDASIAVAALDARVTSGMSGRNRIINGGVSVAQRGSVTSASGSAVYGGPDRFLLSYGGSPGGVITQSLSSFTFGGTTRHSVKQLASTPSTSTTGGNAWFGIVQLIEGLNCFDLVGQPISVSFLFNANTTGTFSVAVRDSTAANSYVTTFSAVSGVPQRVVISIPAIPLTANVPWTTGVGMSIAIGTCNTGTYQAASTNTWVTTNSISAAGTVNWAGGSGNFIEVSELQLESGATATQFEVRSVGTEIALCQRYYRIMVTNFTAYSAAGAGFGAIIPHPVQMRATPSVIFTPSSNSNVNSPTIVADAFGFQNGATAIAQGTAFSSGTAQFLAELA